MAKQYAPLVVANPSEKNQDWNAVMREMSMLAEWVERTFAIDITGLKDDAKIIISSDEPEGNNSQYPWIKISSPPGIGIPFDSGYAMIYPYPKNVPILWTQGVVDLPVYLRALTDDELTSYGLTDPESEDFFHVILEAA